MSIYLLQSAKWIEKWLHFYLSVNYNFKVENVYISFVWLMLAFFSSIHACIAFKYLSMIDALSFGVPLILFLYFCDCDKDVKIYWNSFASCVCSRHFFFFLFEVFLYVRHPAYMHHMNNFLIKNWWKDRRACISKKKERKNAKKTFFLANNKYYISMDDDGYHLFHFSFGHRRR